MLLYKLLYCLKLAEYKISLRIDKALIDKQLCNHTPKKINISTIKTILLVRNDGIGDMVITTPMLRALAQNGYKVSVMSQKSALEVIRHNPYVHETFIWDDRFTRSEVQSLVSEVRSRKFDLVIDMRYPIYFKRQPYRLLLCHHFHGKYTIGWNKSNFKCYDKSINHYTRRGHTITLINKFLEFLGIHHADLRYQFFIDPKVQETAKNYLAQLQAQRHFPIIILNPFTGHPRRDMSVEQIRQTVTKILQKYPQAKFLAIGLKEKIEMLISTINLDEHFVYYPSRSIMDIVPLIQYADLVISPDTSIIHIVSAFEKPLVALYASGRRTPPEYTTAKIKIKERYHELVDAARAHFFDAPNLQNGTRSYGKLLLVEGAFGPNNPNAIKLMNYTHRLSEIPSQNIVNAVNEFIANNPKAFAAGT